MAKRGLKTGLRLVLGATTRTAVAQELSGRDRRQYPYALPLEPREVAGIVGDDQAYTGGPRHGGDVGVVQPPTMHAFTAAFVQERAALPGRKILDVEPRQHLGLQQRDRVGRLQPELL